MSYAESESGGEDDDDDDVFKPKPRRRLVSVAKKRKAPDSGEEDNYEQDVGSPNDDGTSVPAVTRLLCHDLKARAVSDVLNYALIFS